MHPREHTEEAGHSRRAAPTAAAAPLELAPVTVVDLVAHHADRDRQLLRTRRGEETPHGGADILAPVRRIQVLRVDLQHDEVVVVVVAESQSFELLPVVQKARDRALVVIQLTGLGDDVAVGGDDRAEGDLSATALHDDGREAGLGDDALVRSLGRVVVLRLFAGRTLGVASEAAKASLRIERVGEREDGAGCDNEDGFRGEALHRFVLGNFTVSSNSISPRRMDSLMSSPGPNPMMRRRSAAALRILRSRPLAVL